MDSHFNFELRNLRSVSIISIFEFSIWESQIRTNYLWMFFWHDVGFQCARVSAQTNTMKFRKSKLTFTKSPPAWARSSWNEFEIHFSRYSHRKWNWNFGNRKSTVRGPPPAWARGPVKYCGIFIWICSYCWISYCLFCLYIYIYIHVCIYTYIHIYVIVLLNNKREEIIYL